MASHHDSLTDATAETPAMTHLAGLPPAGQFDSEQTISGEMLLMRESSSRLAAKTEEMQAYSPPVHEPAPLSTEEAEMVADDEVEDVEDVDDVDDLEEVEELTNVTDPRGPQRK